MWSRAFFAGIVFTIAVSAASSFSLNDATTFLSQYGYLPESRNKLQNMESFSNALKKYQKFMGIPVSGTLCNTTMKMMQIPRCGVKDFSTNGNISSKYVARSRWEKLNLLYRIGNYPSYLNKMEVDQTIQAAFDIWSKYTDLTFTNKKAGTVDIEISFGPIDGPSNVLAYAYFPPNGYARFDTYERWTINNYQGTNLLLVAAHEFGHSLGLDHTNVYNALMWPSYKKTSNIDLDQDDINGIQRLYGRRKGTTTTERYPVKPTEEVPEWPELPNENICNDVKVDTIFTSDGETFVFKADYYWKIVNYQLEKGYPKLISEKWPGLPGNIDAAFEDHSGKVYFFRGDLCWKFARTQLLNGFPKDISTEFRGIPQNLDAAMAWDNNLYYFFKGNKFWKYTFGNRKSTAHNLNELSGIPNGLDAALVHPNGYTYFFKDSNYYRFNKLYNRIDFTEYYPQPIATRWFGCNERMEIEENELYKYTFT